MGRIQKGLAHSLQASSWVSKCPQRLGELGGYALLSELQGLQRVWATQLCPTRVMATLLLCFLIELLCSLSWDSLGAAVRLNVGLKCQGSPPQLAEHSSQVMGRFQSRSCAGFAALGPVWGCPLSQHQLPLSLQLCHPCPTSQPLCFLSSTGVFTTICEGFGFVH